MVRNKAKLKNFGNLTQKVEAFVEKYDIIKKDKEKIEAQMLKNEREKQRIKEQLEKVLRERDLIKQKLDGIVEKIDSLDLL